MKITIERTVKKEKKFVRFSKRCITAMIAMWFVAALTCVAVVIVQLARGDMTVNTTDLVTCVLAPMTGGIVGYMIKSAIEDNTGKKNTNTEDYSV